MPSLGSLPTLQDLHLFTKGEVPDLSPYGFLGKLHSLLGFPGGSAGKGSTCNEGDLGSIPGWGRFPEEGKGYPLQCSGLENSMGCIVHGVPNSWTRLSAFRSVSGTVRGVKYKPRALPIVTTKIAHFFWISF